MAERVGFGRCQILWLLQVADSKVPGMPRLPGMPWRIARCRTLAVALPNLLLLQLMYALM